MDVRATVNRLGGIASTNDLLRAGCTEYGLTVSVRAGTIRRLRTG